MIVKKNELENMNRFQDSNSSKMYITGCDWKFLYSPVNCELAVLLEVNFIDFLFSFLLFFGFIRIFEKIIFSFFSFFFSVMQQVFELSDLYNHGTVTKIDYYTHLYLCKDTVSIHQ
jgi:hypothetical protein